MVAGNTALQRVWWLAMAGLRTYIRVFLTFAANSLARDMTFRMNFILQSISSMSWAIMNLGFYLIIFSHVSEIGTGTGWGRYEFFVFLGTTWIINSLVQAFCMPNMHEFSELIRTGQLDFALLKPIDTQFLISFRRVEWSALANCLLGASLLAIGLYQLAHRPQWSLSLSPLIVGLYLFYIACGVLILYSLMISLASTSIWLGRNQTLYDFWFYITNFSRYPMEIYQRGWGYALWGLFTFVIPVLLVVNVPARIMARPLTPAPSLPWWMAWLTLGVTVAALFISRRVFRLALQSYRSASS